MKQLSPFEQQLVRAVDQSAMLDRTLHWAAINSGTGNMAGLEAVARALGEAFAVLPGELTLVEPAPVVTVDAAGNEHAQQHGRHMVLRVRPEAPRRVLLTGHMDTVFPVDDPFQAIVWLDDNTVNGPGTADMKGGLSVMLEAMT
jgi:glutamate carboxypeptidase